MLFLVKVRSMLTWRLAPSLNLTICIYFYIVNHVVLNMNNNNNNSNNKNNISNSFRRAWKEGFD